MNKVIWNCLHSSTVVILTVSTNFLLVFGVKPLWPFFDHYCMSQDMSISITALSVDQVQHPVLSQKKERPIPLLATSRLLALMNSSLKTISGHSMEYLLASENIFFIWSLCKSTTTSSGSLWNLETCSPSWNVLINWCIDLIYLALFPFFIDLVYWPVLSIVHAWHKAAWRSEHHLERYSGWTAIF